MLTDLAALTPPFLVAVAFLVAAWAFLRHEMRRGKNPVSGDDLADSSPGSADETRSDQAEQRPVSRSFRESPEDRERDRDS
jgi:hypothetical protein